MSRKTMRWINVLKKAQSRSVDQQYVSEFEIASECRIPGLWNYQGGLLRSHLLTEKDEKGLYRYLVQVTETNFTDDDREEWKKADAEGYYLPGPPSEELMALYSVFFRSRFYLISWSYRELNSTDVLFKNLHRFTYIPCRPEIHPTIFDQSKPRNWAKDLDEFFDQIQKMPDHLHPKFALACLHYLKALREIGIDEEMVFIRLVSAIECLMPNPHDLPEDPFPKNLESFCNLSVLKKAARNSLSDWFNKHRRVRYRYLNFIMRYCHNYPLPKGCEHLADKKKMLSCLGAIYTARSKYLHEARPMFLNDLPSVAQAAYCHYDFASKQPGRVIDQHSWTIGEMLPRAYLFEGLVRHCLLSYLKEKSDVINTH
jgi:hypothetical protein